MKQQSLIGLIASFAVLGSSTIFQSKASAEPHRIFNSVLPQLERRTRVPILLPRELPQLLLQRNNSFYLHLENANANGYEISILTDPNCRGANVCFLGSFSAERISSTAAYASPSSVRELQSQANVSLRGGIKGFFEPLSCGGSCSPPYLQWVYQGVLYRISLRTSNENSDTQRSILVAMASSSLPETSQPTVARSPSSRQQTGAARTPNTPRSATSSNTNTRPKVPTWNQFVASLQGDYINTDFDFPQEFRNGYVYRVQGANWVGVYILKAGLPSYPLPVTSELNQITDGERYVQSGQAIFLLWDLSFSAPRNANDTQVRFSEKGQACLRNTCLTAPSMSNAQIRRILLSERPISQRSRSR